MSHLLVDGLIQFFILVSLESSPLHAGNHRLSFELPEKSWFRKFSCVITLVIKISERCLEIESFFLRFVILARPEAHLLAVGCHLHHHLRRLIANCPRAILLSNSPREQSNGQLGWAPFLDGAEARRLEGNFVADFDEWKARRNLRVPPLRRCVERIGCNRRQ